MHVTTATPSGGSSRRRALKLEELARRCRKAGFPPMLTSTDEDVLVADSDEEVPVTA
jgi:hypothetical protein